MEVKFLRIADDDVFGDIEKVLETIEGWIKNNKKNI